MAEFHEFTDTDVRSRQVSQTAHPRDTPSSSADYSVKITYPRCRIVPWRVGKLRPHPSYARLDTKVSASRLNALLEIGEDAFAFPLTVTSDGIVIDGYARLEIARLQRRATVECIEYDISEIDALRSRTQPIRACLVSGRPIGSPPRSKLHFSTWLRAIAQTSIFSTVWDQLFCNPLHAAVPSMTPQTFALAETNRSNRAPATISATVG